MPFTSAILPRWRGLRPQAKIGVFGALALLVATTGWIVWADWPNAEPPVLPAHADVIVVLGGGGLERPREAWRLVQEGRAPKVIVTGDGDSIVNELRRQGISASVLMHETKAKSTLQNARNVAPLLDALQAKTAILVTSWSHARRATKIFERTIPHTRFFCSFEPRPAQLDDWQRDCQRHERISALYHFLIYGIWCF